MTAMDFAVAVLGIGLLALVIIFFVPNPKRLLVVIAALVIIGGAIHIMRGLYWIEDSFGPWVLHGLLTLVVGGIASAAQGYMKGGLKLWEGIVITVVLYPSLFGLYQLWLAALEMLSGGGQMF